VVMRESVGVLGALHKLLCRCLPAHSARLLCRPTLPAGRLILPGHPAWAPSCLPAGSWGIRLRSKL
jgi:hypothetical protein